MFMIWYQVAVYTYMNLPSRASSLVSKPSLSLLLSPELLSLCQNKSDQYISLINIIFFIFNCCRKHICQSTKINSVTWHIPSNSNKNDHNGSQKKKHSVGLDLVLVLTKIQPLWLYLLTMHLSFEQKVIFANISTSFNKYN